MFECNFFLSYQSIILILILVNYDANGQYYSQNRCSAKLENALENMMRRNQEKSGSRTHLDLTPYSLFQYIPEDNNYLIKEKTDDNKSPLVENKRKHLTISKVEVAELRVKLPENKRWVHVDRCNFSATNRTLDTRLVFPDLTISGRVILHPIGGYCNMILRLRQSGIEFRTIPLINQNNEARRGITASIRTDSHFSEPGFLSVYAYGCQGSGMKFRQNSKRRNFLVRNHNSIIDNINNIQYNRRNNNNNDYLNFDYNEFDIKNKWDHNNLSRSFSQILSSNLNNLRGQGIPNKWNNVASINTNKYNSEAITQELEQMFSMGVRGLLTSYMQKTLQPAIKETLMENIGYKLSYG